MNYKHTQIGWPAIAGGVFAIIAMILGAAKSSTEIMYIFPFVFVVVIFLFGSLTVVIDNTNLSFHFGPGILRKSFRFGDIRLARKVRNHWYYGWGIRWFGKGWLYNVSGLDAIEIVLKKGRIIRIGTDEPDQLINILRTKLPV